MKRTVFGLAILLAALAMDARAVSCGTVASPTACSITVGGQVTYAFGGFGVVAASSSGGGFTYTGADIAIDLASGGGLSAVLTFSKVSAANGVVFLANPGQTAAFTMGYAYAVSAAKPGTVMLASPAAVEIPFGSHAGNGSGTVQFALPGTPPCQAIVSVTPQANCLIPAGYSLTGSTGDIVSLTGNTGNVSIGTFTNVYNATFIPQLTIDVDGNGAYDALTDGLLLIRYLFGLRGSSLIAGAVGAGATRTSAPQIEAFLQSLVP
jgi:hypothetical protein